MVIDYFDTDKVLSFPTDDCGSWLKRELSTSCGKFDDSKISSQSVEKTVVGLLNRFVVSGKRYVQCLAFEGWGALRANRLSLLFARTKERPKQNWVHCVSAKDQDPSLFVRHPTAANYPYWNRLKSCCRYCVLSQGN
jgi:hypothetical protein